MLAQGSNSHLRKDQFDMALCLRLLVFLVVTMFQDICCVSAATTGERAHILQIFVEDCQLVGRSLMEENPESYPP